MPDPRQQSRQQQSGGRPDRGPRAREPVDGDEQARIRDLAREGYGVREIARRTGRSRTTVSKFARGLLADRREQTAAACEATRVDARARRGDLADGLLDDADRLRRMLAEQGDPREASFTVRALHGVIVGHLRLVDADRADPDRDRSDVDDWLAHVAGDPSAPPTDAVAQFLPDAGPAS